MFVVLDRCTSLHLAFGLRQALPGTRDADSFYVQDCRQAPGVETGAGGTYLDRHPVL